MNLTPERHEEILKAVFDNYVRKEVPKPELISVETLQELAEQFTCKPYALHVALVNSSCRINHEKPTEFHAIIDDETITKTMMLVIKDKIKQLAVSPVIWTRYFINTVDKLNEENRDLNLTPGEFINFFHPIYWEAITELVGK